MLIRNLQKLAEAVPVGNGLPWNKIQPWIQQAQTVYLKSILGKDLIAELELALDTAPSDIQAELLGHITFALGNLAMMDYAPIAGVTFSEGGAKQGSGENFQPATQWATRDAIRGYMDAGFRRLEEIITFLEENLPDFDAWKESNYFKLGRPLIIPNALIFDQYYKIGESGWMYLQQIPHIKQFEQGPMLSLLGGAYYNELKADIRADVPDLTDAEKALVDLLRQAAAPFSIMKSLLRLAIDIGPDGVTLHRTNTSQSVKAFDPASADDKAALIASAKEDFESALASAREYMYANADSFPTWKASTAYESSTATFQNDPLDGIFFTGR